MAALVSGRLVESATLEDALDGASLVTMATKATHPVLLAEHLKPGMHVNSVGPASRDRIEVDPDIFASFHRVVCDSVELVLDEAGDAFRAVATNSLQRHHVQELSSIVSGQVGGRANDGEITLFKSVGTGAQDLIVASHLLDLAATAGLGVVVGDVNSVKPLPAIT
jgi:ornithine cyclodeaminase/alanine dehydrogenase-like protein (mu-crystallin family)